MLTKNQIIDLIKENRAPYWTVHAKKVPFAKEKENKGFFKPETKDTIEDDQINKSLERFELLCSFIQHEKCYCFEIVMKPNEKSSGASILTYEFVINENQEGNTNKSVTGLNGPGSGMLSDLSHMQALGYVPSGMIEVLEAKNKASLEGLEQRILLKAREDRLLEREKELAEKLKESDSAAEKLSKAATKFVNGYLDDWIKEDKPNLKGSEVTTTKKEISDSEDTPARKVISDIALTLDNNFKDEKSLQKIKEIVDGVIKTIKNPNPKKEEETKDNNENNENPT